MALIHQPLGFRGWNLWGKALFLARVWIPSKVQSIGMCVVSWKTLHSHFSLSKNYFVHVIKNFKCTIISLMRSCRRFATLVGWLAHSHSKPQQQQPAKGAYKEKPLSYSTPRCTAPKCNNMTFLFHKRSNNRRKTSFFLTSSAHWHHARNETHLNLALSVRCSPNEIIRFNIFFLLVLLSL